MDISIAYDSVEIIGDYYEEEHPTYHMPHAKNMIVSISVSISNFSWIYFRQPIIGNDFF